MPRNIQGRAYLSPAETAEAIGCSVRTLGNWRLDGSGPAFMRLYGGPRGRVLYDLEAVELRIAARIAPARIAEKMKADRAKVKAARGSLPALPEKAEESV